MGKIRSAGNANLDVVANHSEEPWDLARSTMDLADEMLPANKDRMPFPEHTQPLPGAFFLNNWFSALAMHPYVSVQYNLDKLGRFLIVKEASASSQGNKMGVEDIKFRIDHTKTRLIVPYFRLS